MENTSTVRFSPTEAVERVRIALRAQPDEVLHHAATRALIEYPFIGTFVPRTPSELRAVVAAIVALELGRFVADDASTCACCGRPLTTFRWEGILSAAALAAIGLDAAEHGRAECVQGMADDMLAALLQGMDIDLHPKRDADGGWQ